MVYRKEKRTRKQVLTQLRPELLELVEAEVRRRKEAGIKAKKYQVFEEALEGLLCRPRSERHQMACCVVTEALELRKSGDAVWRERMYDAASLEIEAAAAEGDIEQKAMLYRCAALLMVDAGALEEAQQWANLGLTIGALKKNA